MAEEAGKWERIADEIQKGFKNASKMVREGRMGIEGLADQLPSQIVNSGPAGSEGEDGGQSEQEVKRTALLEAETWAYAAKHSQEEDANTKDHSESDSPFYGPFETIASNGKNGKGSDVRAALKSVRFFPQPGSAPRGNLQEEKLKECQGNIRKRSNIGVGVPRPKPLSAEEQVQWDLQLEMAKMQPSAKQGKTTERPLAPSKVNQLRKDLSDRRRGAKFTNKKPEETHTIQACKAEEHPPTDMPSRLAEIEAAKQNLKQSEAELAQTSAFRAMLDAKIAAMELRIAPRPPRSTCGPPPLLPAPPPPFGLAISPPPSPSAPTVVSRPSVVPRRRGDEIPAAVLQRLEELSAKNWVEYEAERARDAGAGESAEMD